MINMNLSGKVSKCINLILGIIQRIPNFYFYMMGTIASGYYLFLINQIPEKVVLDLSLTDCDNVDSLVVKCCFYFSIDNPSWSLHTNRGNYDISRFLIALKDDRDKEGVSFNLQVLKYEKDTILLTDWDIIETYFEKNELTKPKTEDLLTLYDGPTFHISYSFPNNSLFEPRDKPYDEYYLKSEDEVIYYTFVHSIYNSYLRKRLTNKHVTLCFPTLDKDSVKIESFNLINKNSFSIFSPFDISQCMVLFHIKDFFKGSSHRNFMGETNELGLFFGSSATISHVNVKPDSYVYNGIEYNDSTKLANLDYLQFHVEYTDFKNLQYLRNFVITTITVTLFGLFTKSFWSYIRKQKGNTQSNNTSKKDNRKKGQRRRRKNLYYHRKRKHL